MNPISAMLNLFLPRECHLCGRGLAKEEAFICAPCAETLPKTGYERYWSGGAAQGSSIIPGRGANPNAGLNPMESRFAGQLPMGRACAAYFYSRDSRLATLVHDFKYRGFSGLAVRLGALAAESLKGSGLFAGVELLLPVPLHWSKKWRRGYNQSAMIARGVSEATGIPVGTCLTARRPHRTQTTLSHEQRIANTRGIFAVKNPASLRGRHVMLVDDICTTGATLLSAGETLAEATGHDIRISIFTLGTVH